jgi:hypothetical protein
VIKFADALFDGPHEIGAVTTPARAGVYCVMVGDTRFQPLPYRVVYVGQSSNLGEQVFPALYEGRHGWSAIADYASPVYIAVCWMPRSTEEERQAVEREVIRCYHPECNELLPELSLLAH